jgi:hypothetical protein
MPVLSALLFARIAIAYLIILLKLYAGNQQYPSTRLRSASCFLSGLSGILLGINFTDRALLPMLEGLYKICSKTKL